MVTLNNVFNNKNITCTAHMGNFYVYEHDADRSVGPFSAMNAYFMKEMNVKRRQALVVLNGGQPGVRVQAGAMQWTAGAVDMDSDVGGVGGLFGKMVKGAVTGESAVKPVYRGAGYLMLEPTYNFLLLEDVGSWGSGIVLNDGMFLACDEGIKHSVVRRTNASSAIAGGEGLFNLSLSGQGTALLESPVPREELFEFVLDNDVLKIDGNMAVAWSSTLNFTVEKSAKGLIGSGLSGEGFVNVYRGTGKVLMAPTLDGTVHRNGNGPEQTAATSSHGMLGSIGNSLLDL